MSLSIEDIKSIAKKITSTKERTNYNSIVKLINELKSIPFKSQNDLQDNDELEQKLRFLIVSLFQIFKKLFARDELTPINKKTVKSVDLIKFNEWCRRNYNIFKSKLLLIISDLHIETSLALDSLDLYLQLLELESVHLASSKDTPFFPNKTLKNLLIALWKSDLTKSNSEIDPITGQSKNFILLEFLEKYYKPFADIQFYFQMELNKLLNVENSNEDNRKELDGFVHDSEISIAKWLTLVNHDQNCSDKDVDLEVFVSNPPTIIENDSKFKSFLEKNWLTLLNCNSLSFTQYKTILLILHKRIIPHFHTPTKLMDFLTDSYNLQASTENKDIIGVIPILALNGLFELMKQFNLEYPNFYEKLYQLITPDLMHVKYRPRFFRLMELFLQSTHVSVHLIASFIKRLARLSLNAPPAAIVTIIPFIYNLLKKHPNCMIMIHNPNFISNPFQTDDEKLQLKENIKNYTDPFKMDEQDPELTDAFESSLWELATLREHYHPNVASLAKIFGQPFRKLRYNMEDFLDWSYDTLINAESTRKLKILPTLEFETYDLVFEDSEKGDKTSYLQNVAW